MKSLALTGLSESEELRRFMEGLLEKSPAEQTEVSVTEWDSALTRYANNGIHQNVAERNAGVRIRVVKDGRTGVASLNQLSEKAAAEVLSRALAIAELQPPGEVVPLPGAAPASSVKAWSDATAGATPEDRATSVE